MAKKLFVLAALLIVALSLCAAQGCGSGAQAATHDITGKWSGSPENLPINQSVDETIEFKSDGTAHKTVDFSEDQKRAHIDGDYTYTLTGNILKMHPTNVQQTGEQITDPTNSNAEESTNIYWSNDDSFKQEKVNGAVVFHRVKDPT